ncbi:hypothetical protein FZO89_16705 [Luteimonas viscosa]|uniref:Uncharacterized protein n=1 Tax=Luteimonas viscosa TaxID=1132694 RepID=A0A5D4XIU3_9GAMM|nr:hypothetical protein FZO89_16705 [Luteimonas viscosa]
MAAGHRFPSEEIDMKRTCPTGSLLALALALALPATAQPPPAEPENDTGYGIQGGFEEEAGSDPFDDPTAEADPWSEVEAGADAGSEESFDSLSESRDHDDAFAADPADPRDAADIAPEPADAGASTSAELKDGLRRMFVGVLMPAVERRVRKAVEGDDAPQSDPVPQADP